MSDPVYEDVLYEERDAVATITVNRPDKLNAYRTQTYTEVTDALLRAGWNRDIGVIVLTGAGTRAFGVGGDTSEKKSERTSGHGTIGVPVEHLQSTIRDIPKSPSLQISKPSPAASRWIISPMATIRSTSRENMHFGEITSRS